jgi:hypothetical protein
MDARLADALYAIERGLYAFAGAVSVLKVALADLDQKLPDDPNQAVAKLRADLEWRGPGGKKAGNICLPREMAEQLLEWIDGNERGI